MNDAEALAQMLEEFITNGRIIVLDSSGRKYGIVVDAVGSEDGETITVHFGDDPKAQGVVPLAVTFATPERIWP